LRPHGFLARPSGAQCPERKVSKLHMHLSWSLIDVGDNNPNSLSDIRAYGGAVSQGLAEILHRADSTCANSLPVRILVGLRFKKFSTTGHYIIS
jgi:hypothetical protein